MSEYTKGPWKAVRNARTASVITDMADGSYGQAIAICQQVLQPCVIANAKLIACAPEMAEMLLWLRSYLADGEPTKLDALLKKAGVL